MTLPVDINDSPNYTSDEHADHHNDLHAEYNTPTHTHSGSTVWQDYTPTLTQSGAVTKTVTRGRYCQSGTLVHVSVYLSVTGTGTGTNEVLIGLPVAAAASVADCSVGVGRLYDASANLIYRAIANAKTTTTIKLELTGNTTGNGLGVTGFTAGLASGDVVEMSCTYEAAAAP